MLSLDAPILLVDDTVTEQQHIGKILLGAGFINTHVANNGKEALDKIKAAAEVKQMFKIIFLDWDMPEMDGLAFLKICRNDFALKDIAIIMVTSFSDQKKLILALGSGATTYMIKPVSGEAILRKVEQIGKWMDA